MRRAFRLHLASVLALAVSAACSSKDDGRFDDGLEDEDIPPASECPESGDTEGCGSTGSGATDGSTQDATGAAGDGEDQCKASDECEGGLMCAAPFEGNDRGAFECVAVCVGVMDEGRWCADAEACCSPEAICTSRGYCVEDGGTGTDSGTSGTEGTGASG